MRSGRLHEDLCGSGRRSFHSRRWLPPRWSRMSRRACPTARRRPDAAESSIRPHNFRFLSLICVSRSRNASSAIWLISVFFERRGIGPGMLVHLIEDATIRSRDFASARSAAREDLLSMEASVIESMRKLMGTSGLRISWDTPAMSDPMALPAVRWRSRYDSLISSTSRAFCTATQRSGRWCGAGSGHRANSTGLLPRALWSAIPIIFPSRFRGTQTSAFASFMGDGLLEPRGFPAPAPSASIPPSTSTSFAWYAIGKRVPRPISRAE